MEGSGSTRAPERPLRSAIEAFYAKQVAALTDFPAFRALELGAAPRADYDRFIENVARVHLRSPQLLAFLYAIAAPAATDKLLHNMLEELGIDQESGVPHPSLLRQLVIGAGLADRLPRLERLAEEDIRRVVVDPLLYGTLKEVGLAALCEIVGFEFMLSRVSSRIARALAIHRGLSAETIEWFSHHSEVDIRHAEEGLDDLEAFINYYGFSDADAMTIIEMTLRENIFVNRYFAALSPDGP